MVLQGFLEGQFIAFFENMPIVYKCTYCMYFLIVLLLTDIDHVTVVVGI